MPPTSSKKNDSKGKYRTVAKRHQPYSSSARSTTGAKRAVNPAHLARPPYAWDESMSSSTPLPVAQPNSSRTYPSRGSHTFPSSSDTLTSSRTPSSTPSSSSISSPPPQSTRPVLTMRDIAMEVIRKKYPYFTPRNDWELLYLRSAPYRGTDPEGLYQLLDRHLQSTLQSGFTYEGLMKYTKSTLDEHVDITGFKPRPGETYGVFIRPIPKSEYSIRLFPGSAASRDYCLDFVLTATGEPVNSPFKFELFAGPGPDTPIGFAPTIALRPLDCAFGFSQEQIPPGEEKFLLREGQSCALRRPGHRDVRFTVPKRRRPEPPKQTSDADFLELPAYID
ncbi:hypothetical protein C8Q77DRAFT_1139751 [Trametes polyzona]|nr:hypothetical protein C8Q77DRAFT_1139751 [Trametes polyzona]